MSLSTRVILKTAKESAVGVVALWPILLLGGGGGAVADNLLFLMASFSS